MRFPQPVALLCCSPKEGNCTCKVDDLPSGGVRTFCACSEKSVNIDPFLCRRPWNLPCRRLTCLLQTTGRSNNLSEECSYYHKNLNSKSPLDLEIETIGSYSFILFFPYFMKYLNFGITNKCRFLQSTYYVHYLALTCFGIVAMPKHVGC